MKVLIEAPFDISDANKTSIEQDLKELSLYNKKMTQATAYFKLDDGVKSDVVLAEIQLHVPGPVIFVSETDQKFMKAFAGAVSKARRQLKKAKDIRQDHHA